MSEYWEFFPCTIRDNQASIFYDYGIKDEIDSLSYRYVFKIRAEIKLPNDDGLTASEEFDEITGMEDILSDELEKHGCIFVGRITVDGYRYFTFYTNTSENILDKTVAKIANHTGYKLGTVYESDPEKTEYWQNLFPTRADWQVIQDIKVLEALREAGDPLLKARRIDHWAYFKNENDINRFSTWLIQNGYEIQHMNEPDKENDDYGIQFYNVATPNLREITSITIALNTKADEIGGEYSGWETSVEKIDA